MVYDGVHDGQILGEGVSGVVREVVRRATGVRYAMKRLPYSGMASGPEGLEQLTNEIFIMCQLDMPYIVRIEEVYASPDEMYIVQELCSGGELFDRLEDQPDLHYTEAHCAKLVKQMATAVRYLHHKGIVHRDLKLEASFRSGHVLVLVGHCRLFRVHASCVSLLTCSIELANCTELLVCFAETRLGIENDRFWFIKAFQSWGLPT